MGAKEDISATVELAYLHAIILMNIRKWRMEQEAVIAASGHYHHFGKDVRAGKCPTAKTRQSKVWENGPSYGSAFTRV